jgi:hypothetical protein
VHTIVLVSDNARSDASLQKAFEEFYPERRIEVINILRTKLENEPLGAGSA